MRDVLFQIQSQGGIMEGWTVTSPDPRQIPENQRLLGIAGIFTFTATLELDVRKVQINGTLSV